MNISNTEKPTFTPIKIVSDGDLLKYLLKEGTKTKDEFITEITERFFCYEDFVTYINKS